jgi:hypothetical protein
MMGKSTPQKAVTTVANTRGSDWTPPSRKQTPDRYTIAARATVGGRSWEQRILLLSPDSVFEHTTSTCLPKLSRANINAAAMLPNSSRLGRGHSNQCCDKKNYARLR